MHTMVILNPGDQQLCMKYKKLRNELTSSLRNSELMYFSHDLEMNKSDLHKAWGTMKKIIGKDANYSKKKKTFKLMENLRLIAVKSQTVSTIFLSRLDLNLQRTLLVPQIQYLT